MLGMEQPADCASNQAKDQRSPPELSSSSSSSSSSDVDEDLGELDEDLFEVEDELVEHPVTSHHGPTIASTSELDFPSQDTEVVPVPSFDMALEANTDEGGLLHRPEVTHSVADTQTDDEEVGFLGRPRVLTTRQAAKSRAKVFSWHREHPACYPSAQQPADMAEARHYRSMHAAEVLDAGEAAAAQARSDDDLEFDIELDLDDPEDLELAETPEVPWKDEPRTALALPTPEPEKELGGPSSQLSRKPDLKQMLEDSKRKLLTPKRRFLSPSSPTARPVQLLNTPKLVTQTPRCRAFTMSSRKERGQTDAFTMDEGGDGASNTAGDGAGPDEPPPKLGVYDATDVWLENADLSVLTRETTTSDELASEVTEQALNWHVWKLSQEHESMLQMSHMREQLLQAAKDPSVAHLRKGPHCEKALAWAKAAVRSETEIIAAYLVEASQRSGSVRALTKEYNTLQKVAEELSGQLQASGAPNCDFFSQEELLREEIESKDRELASLEQRLAEATGQPPGSHQAAAAAPDDMSVMSPVSMLREEVRSLSSRLESTRHRH